MSPTALAHISKEHPDRSAQQVMSDNVHAMCVWRDEVAREEDEGATILECFMSWLYMHTIYQK